MAKEELVVIVGAGPSGLAAAACLSVLSIPYVLLERDGCAASLWRHRSYDRLSLHLPKQVCQLPHFPHPSATPTFIPKKAFIQYLDDYAAKFDIRPLFHRQVKTASFDPEAARWRILVENRESGEAEEYAARFLVAASGENDEPVVPEFPGMAGFGGRVVHSSRYRSAVEFKGEKVLVVGSGNSGMEIAYDLADNGAKTSIVVRSSLHLVAKEIWVVGLLLLKILPCDVVDSVVLFLCYLKFGDTARYGLPRPAKGPFFLKLNTPSYPVVDVGTFQKIKSGEIQVLPALASIEGNDVTFADGKSHSFDAIILATGYRSTIKKWLKGDDYLIGEDGMCKQSFPNHWKGRNGLYCSGLVRRGIYGAAEDAVSIANDINDVLQSESGKKE